MSNTITPTVYYPTLNVEGLEIFYREACPRDAPTVLLLHGFPSSPHMFRNLIPTLADKYHVVAPDFPGYGQSSAPSVHDFDYSDTAPFMVYIAPEVLSFYARRKARKMGKAVPGSRD